MDNKSLRYQQTQFEIASQIQTYEGQLRVIIESIKLRGADPQSLIDFLNTSADRMPVATPVLCERTRAEFPGHELITSELLNEIIINSYDTRIARNEPGVKVEKEKYLYSIGKKNIPTSSEEPQEA